MIPHSLVYPCMALTQTKQILETIRRSQRPLIVVPRGAGIDGYATALGLAHLTDKIGPVSDIVAVDGPAPASISFLKNIDRIHTELPHLRKLIIDIDISKTTIQNVEREEKDGRCLFSLTPTQGFWNQNDVRISTSEYHYDLLICIGASELESCAHLYEMYPDFFFRTPIVNIDHSPTNEHFGHINMVDITASACGEICHDLIQEMDPELFDEEVATAFLTGMIAKTKSFKTQQVTPKTLQTASRLMAHGARRDEIVRHLYRTRSVSTLRLWGRTLARLKSDPSANVVWSLLSQQDFLHAGAEEHDLHDVIDELICSSPQVQVAVLLYERADRTICAVVRVEHPWNAKQLISVLQPTGTETEARLCFKDKTLLQVENEIIPLLIDSVKK
ncbi:MAG: Exopolyphosphatase-related protein [Candidatus Uhrbacteria bacterium GW2011_GWF2_41_16]|uniref:Exopolyphosphatase-related protein n=2 Tax=Candidatus Uhriibacteriota TaxID=1752732 RepID=A0A0G0VB56_9BACT|nr:MAG: Exopolyphosphatase-related protein [Candidatus Uhrbacteria bacterium GW2011_GWC2_41_11]KKR98148.1 MAG: Exopolyphosphatase-related protein [Candidatus Uhrbacteria bacterium GW2011_GWF2_41_16]HBP00485.1 hypothetical protein [Candidatus Uhrbacteria bacterium]